MHTARLPIDGNREADSTFECRIAATREDRRAAFRLTYAAYLGSGLTVCNRHRMRVTPYQLLASTDMFVAEIAGEISATVTLVADGDLELPMQLLYPAEINDRRASGLFLGEVSCLAHRPETGKHRLRILMALYRIMVQTATARARPAAGGRPSPARALLRAVSRL